MLPNINWQNEQEVKQAIVKAKKEIAGLMKRDLGESLARNKRSARG